MSGVFALLAILIAGALFGLLWVILQKLGRQESQNQEWAQNQQKQAQSLREEWSAQFLGLSRQVNEHLAENNRFLSQNTQSYADAMGQVQSRLGELQESARQMRDIGKNISSLQDILQAPKLRGGLGEFFLAELLKQVLPAQSFEMQYAFANGAKVDAVIRLEQKLVPVDAKFPLENFKRLLSMSGQAEEVSIRKEFLRDVKKHIDAIASKYILPEEGTFDFAFMYIPAENVYYEIILKADSGEDLLEYAQKKRVIPVSPNSFYAYLMALAHGFRGMKIEKSAREILEKLGQLETDFQRSLEDFEKMGTHLQHALASYRATEKRLEKFKSRLEQLDQKTEIAQSEPAAGTGLLPLSGNLS